MTEALLAEFAQAFRDQAYAGLEYSYDEVESRRSMTVAGKPGFAVRAARFAASLRFAADWAWAVQQFTSFVRPDAYLLRVDSRAEEIIALTLYCRFPIEPVDSEFDASAIYLRPLQWQGPTPSRIALVLGVPGPRGIGVRVNKKGQFSTALYYAVGSPTIHLARDTLTQLVDLCGLPPHLTDTILEDVRELYNPGPVGVIGIDSAGLSSGNALKLNPANVPLDRAFKFLKRKLVPDRRITQIAQIAGSLRAIWTSYFGCKYSATGFDGWRLYFSTQPGLTSAPAAPRISVEKICRPTIRLPHY
jgi:hypothetical protein